MMTLSDVANVLKSQDNIEILTHHYPDGGCEQEAADWWMSAVRAMMMLRELAPEYVKRVDAIGVSGHMLGCLPMDSEGQTLRPAMIHADTRALAISNALRARYGRDYFYEICGNVLSPASTLCKTLWLKEHEPELYARTVRILQSKDYLVYRLLLYLLSPLRAMRHAHARPEQAEIIVYLRDRADRGARVL